MGNCCIECFNESVIREFIEPQGLYGDCEYCDSQRVLVSDTETVGNFIREGLARAYENVQASGVYEDPITHKYTVGDTVDNVLYHSEGVFSENLFVAGNEEHLVNDLFSDSGPDWKDISNGDEDWLDNGNAHIVRINEYYGEFDNRYSSAWDSFKQRVKYHGRFFDFEGDADRESLIAPIFDFFPKLESTLPKDTLLYRSRVVSGDLPEDDNDAKKIMGPAPVQSSSHSRMSPPGISYFYLSEDINTSVTEIRALVGSNVWVACFRIKSDLKIIDFTKLPDIEIPSIFEDEYDHDLWWAEDFFKDFLQDVSRPPTSRDNLLEYVPTQVLAELIKSKGYQGLKFKSSQNSEGNNYTLFCSPNHDFEHGFWPSSEIFEDWAEIQRIDTYSITRQLIEIEQENRRDINPDRLTGNNDE